MQFHLALALTPPERILPLAKTAEEAGWDGIAMPDSVFFPREVSGSYPFTEDGNRFWSEDSPFTDPLVAIPAIAACTENLRFVTNVLKTPLREPLLVAKTVASIASMFPGRFELGLGLSWMPEEFAWLGQEMKTRGKRLDEQIEIISKIMLGGWVHHHGKHYEFEDLKMEPTPGTPIPIHVGGHSDAAIQRAARVGDGWIGAQVNRTELQELIGRIHTALADHDRPTEGFSIQATPIVAPTLDAMSELQDDGLTGVITVPWYFYPGDSSSIEHQHESIMRFANDVIHPMRGR